MCYSAAGTRHSVVNINRGCLFAAGAVTLVIASAFPYAQRWTVGLTAIRPINELDQSRTAPRRRARRQRGVRSEMKGRKLTEDCPPPLEEVAKARENRKNQKCANTVALFKVKSEHPRDIMRSEE
jgi:hypothetical protein